MARTDLELAKVEEGEDEVASGGGARELAVGLRQESWQWGCGGCGGRRQNWLVELATGGHRSRGA